MVGTHALYRLVGKKRSPSVESSTWPSNSQPQLFRKRPKNKKWNYNFVHSGSLVIHTKIERKWSHLESRAVPSSQTFDSQHMSSIGKIFRLSWCIKLKLYKRKIYIATFLFGSTNFRLHSSKHGGFMRTPETLMHPINTIRGITPHLTTHDREMVYVQEVR